MTPAPAPPTVTLNNGIEIPQLGFGTWHLRRGDIVFPSP